MVNYKENPIWEYFEENKMDSKFANCKNCKKKLSKGSELTVKQKTPNLKLHLKTRHPELHSELIKKESCGTNKIVSLDKEMTSTTHMISRDRNKKDVVKTRAGK